MKFFASALVALVANSFVPTVRGCVPEELITKLTFFDATVDEAQNTLHKPGGELVFQNVGEYQNEQIDLVITAVDSMNPDWPYSNIEQSWKDAGLKVPTGNGKKPDGGFGRINLRTIEGEPKSGEGNFQFCLVNHDTGNLITLPKFQFTIYDIDSRSEGNEKEKLIVDFNTPGYAGYQLPANSELKIVCEDKNDAAGCPNSRTVFKSTTSGTGPDNPDDPDNLTDLQISRSVGFVFEGVSCFQFTYDHYCQYDQPWYKGDVERCNKYTGGNFLFAGYSEEITDHTTCMPVPAVSEYPSYSPTLAPIDPTPEPTSPPTDPPTSPPTEPPTNPPTSPPTEPPTNPPTSPPTEPPTSPPTEPPTVEHSAGPTVEHSAAPTVTGSAAPTVTASAAPTVTGSAAPTVTASAAPTVTGSAAPTVTASAAPTVTGSAAPTVTGSAAPTVTGSAAPTVTASAAPTVSDSASPTVTPPTDHPSCATPEVPSASPTEETEVPSEAPSASPTEATDVPSAAPSEGCDPVPPTPVTSPPTVAPECPADIKLVHQVGDTPIGIAGAIQIVEQNTDTVVVQLTNSWVESSENIDQIFYQYKPDYFNEKCYSNSTVPGGDTYNEIEIQCLHSKPFAELEICVVDEDNLLPGDDATVPKCCHNEEEGPTVCYILTINCVTECIEEIERRGLRGKAT